MMESDANGLSSSSLHNDNKPQNSAESAGTEVQDCVTSERQHYSDILSSYQTGPSQQLQASSLLVNHGASTSGLQQPTPQRPAEQHDGRTYSDRYREVR